MPDKLGPKDHAERVARRLSSQSLVDAFGIVVCPEGLELALQIARIPEEGLIEELATYGADRPLNKGWERGTPGTVLTSSVPRMRRLACHRCDRKSGS